MPRGLSRSRNTGTADAAITLLRFRLDYLSHQKLVKEADRQEFDRRWSHTVQRLQEDERLGDQEAADSRLTL
ncbi:MAG: hypothetical protein VX405_05270, partial [Myxococcota bacterium]|nr:hypothetical protein [Myxococcota bacterium]